MPTGTDHDFSGMEANTALEGPPVGALHIVGISPQRCLHGQGGVAGP